MQASWRCRRKNFVTPQEQQLLTSLTQKINQTQLQEKDPDAENLLGREIGANPDALYILAQTVLVQNIALDQAKAQVAQLQQQLQQNQQSRPQPAHATTFLGRLLGDRDPEPVPQQPPPYQPVPQYAQPQYSQQAPPYAAPQYQQAQYVPVQGGQPSFLRGAMQTAAGVAAGALAFEGVESILHGIGGYGHSGMGMGGFGPGMGGGFERPVEETVINNNYYDQPGTQGFDHESGSGHHLNEPVDPGADKFADTGDRSSEKDDSGNDQVGFDNSNSDDASGFDSDSDNAGGFDDGGQDDAGLDDGGSGFDDGGGGFGGDGGSDLV